MDRRTPPPRSRATRAHVRSIDSGLLVVDPPNAADITSRTVGVGAMDLDILEAGPEDGEHVILLHGFPQTTEAWRPLLAVLANGGWRVTAVKQRGYSDGARPNRTSEYRIDLLVDDILGVADVLDAERFHVMGHDWGGAVAWRLASTHPHRLRSLTSLATPHPAALARSMFGAQALRSVYAAWFQLPVGPSLTLNAGDNALLRVALERSGLSERWVRAYTEAMDRPTLDAALRWYRATPPWDLARTGSVTVPTLYVWGSRDAALGPAAAGRTGDHVDAPYRFVTLDATHWLPEEHSEDVGAALLSHLDTYGGT
jgi:pimeloyl-ACP methyl ester carboxylesterase